MKKMKKIFVLLLSVCLLSGTIAGVASAYTPSGWEAGQYGWMYYNSDGTKYNGWLKDKGKWYYIDVGYMVSDGVYDIGGKYYIFKKNGVLVDTAGWYKCRPTADSGVFWYYVKKGGACTTGWKKISGTWYYFMKKNGSMAADGKLTTNGKMYLFKKSGAWIGKTGWQKWDGDWYYLKKGVVQTGWLKKGGKWYYLQSDGIMATEWLNIGGKSYYFNPVSGQMYAGDRYKINGNFYTFAKGGALIDADVSQ